MQPPVLEGVPPASVRATACLWGCGDAPVAVAMSDAPRDLDGAVAHCAAGALPGA